MPCLRGGAVPAGLVTRPGGSACAPAVGVVSRACEVRVAVDRAPSAVVERVRAGATKLARRRTVIRRRHRTSVVVRP